MNILIAPDSFKGSLSAVEFCEIADRVLQKHSTHHSNTASKHIKTHLMPLADGGEGTVDAVLTHLNARKYSVNVHNAIGISTFAHYAYLSADHPDNHSKTDTAIIEMAQACGLPDIPLLKRNPMKTSTFGVGELIKHALDRGARRFIIGLGGSATNDGGMGMLSALGVQFYTEDDKRMLPAGQMLELIHRIDTSRMDPRLKDCQFIIASDVTNPLLGEQGATHVFAPQKGADEDMVASLEKGMASFAQKTLDTLDLDESLLTTAGAGAAGGLGFALLAYLKADIQSGFDILSELVGLDNILTDAELKPDLIITGEGQFDEQSLNGKLTGRMIEKAREHQIVLKIVCGDYNKDIEQQLNDQVELVSLRNNGISMEQAMEQTAELLEERLESIIKDFVLMPEIENTI